MKCDEKRLFLYMEGRCSDSERMEVEAHLKQCRKCRENLEKLSSDVKFVTKVFKSAQISICPENEELVSLVEDELAAGNATRLRDHIAACKECRQKYEQLMIFKQNEEGQLEELPDAPPLSLDNMALIEGLKQQSIRKRLEKVIRTLLKEGKATLSSDRITDVLNQVMPVSHELVHEYAMRNDLMRPDRELTFRVPGITDISVHMGMYHLNITTCFDSLKVGVLRNGIPQKGMEVTVNSKHSTGESEITDKYGECIFTLKVQGPYNVKVSIPDED